jgi:hypothetical protein
VKRGGGGLRVKNGVCKIKSEEQRVMFFVFCLFHMGDVMDILCYDYLCLCISKTYFFFGPYIVIISALIFYSDALLLRCGSH